MILRAAAESHTGYVRANNQDTALISGDLLAVADGMGGHLGGEVAARTAIEELLQAYLRDRTGAGLESAVRRANQAIWRKSRADRKLHGMGTTLTAVALVEGEAAVARDAAGRGDSGGQRSHLALVNVGDSRAYSIDPDTREMKRLTEDHSVVEEMVRQGELTPDEAAVHPHRHVLTRALGIDSEVDLDIWDLEPALGSRILLCSDGLTNEVTENEIAQVLAASPDPAEAARELVGRALGHGGMDNVTVVVIDVLEGEDVASQPVEMIPPPPGSPDLREQAGGADITQALPITRAGAEAAPSVSRETTDAIPATPEDPDATQALGSEDRPEPGAVGPAAAAAGAAAAAPAAAGVATEALGAATPADASAQQAGTPASSTSEQPSVASPPSAGAAAAAGAAGPRSMTMRGSAPSSQRNLGASERTGSERTGSGHPMVLVPGKRFSGENRDRIVTFRVFLFVLVMAGLVGGVVAVVIWFQRSSYFVGLEGARVSIYQGRPGGLLWFKPQLLETTGVTTRQLLPNTVQEIRHGVSEPSYDSAKKLVRLLSREQNLLGLSSAGTTTTVGLPPITTVATTTLAGSASSVVATAPTSSSPATTPTTAVTTTTKPKKK